MTHHLSLEQRNAVLIAMAEAVEAAQQELLRANQKDMEAFSHGEKAMRDRLKMDEGKVMGMATALRQLAFLQDPLGQERYNFIHDNGLRISNRTAPFGTILIIYESRPDVTIEAAGIAFKSGNRILLKGGKEALNSNLALVELWHRVLKENGHRPEWITYLNMDRTATQQFLEHPTEKVDLIVPRGGDRLIAFVKQHATCPVIISGRGNNFLYVDEEANRSIAQEIIINAKIDKISACNALDKVLISADLPEKNDFILDLIDGLKGSGVEVLGDFPLSERYGIPAIADDSVWEEEFLDYKIVLGEVSDMDQAIEMINKYGGGHSASILTDSSKKASLFMESVDAAAVYHNASTRFTDGGEFGLGGELAISTDKLHQRGPIGLQHLVTNKWFVYGEGQVRS